MCWNRLVDRKGALKSLDFIIRLWLGYVLIRNSAVGIITPLEELGLDPRSYGILKSMWDTGFMMHLVKATELLGGLALVFNRFVPLALVALIPVIVNIFGTHIFLFNNPIGQGLAMLLAVGLITFHRRETFRPLFRSV